MDFIKPLHRNRHQGALFVPHVGSSVNLLMSAAHQPTAVCKKEAPYAICVQFIADSLNLRE